MPFTFNKVGVRQVRVVEAIWVLEPKPGCLQQRGPMIANIMERMTECDWMPMMGFGMLFMALFWVVLIVGVVLAVRWFTGEGFARREDSALDILQKRYARGELTKQEFEERKRDLLV